MRSLLRIGEVARLLGVTTKTVRHWERSGLLPPARRSEAGYRLYAASDLLRLQRIRRLQALGLSLRRIKAIVAAPDHERPWKQVLRALRDDITGQIETLTARRDRITALLAEDTLDALDHTDELPPTLRRLREQWPEHMARVSDDLLEQDKKLYAVLDGFRWAEGHDDATAAAARYLAEHPALYQELLALTERLAALAHAPVDSPEADRLAEDMSRFLATHPDLSGLEASLSPLDATFDTVLQETVATTFAPAQRRFVEEMMRKEAARASEEAGSTHEHGARRKGTR